MKKGFTLVELLVVITILAILSNIGLNTFTSAQKKSRDAKRKAHLKQLSDAFEAYYNDQGQYPESTDGNISGCGDDAQQECTWGQSAFSNTTTNTVYMTELPTDPTQGYKYYYEGLKDAQDHVYSFQLYARLENDQDIAVPKSPSDKPQHYDGLSCGEAECNYGVSSYNITPADGRSLEPKE